MQVDQDGGISLKALLDELRHLPDAEEALLLYRDTIEGSSSGL